MSEYKRSDMWDHTAALRMQTAAANASKGRTIRLEDFHPFHGRSHQPAAKGLNRQQGGKLLDSVFGLDRRRRNDNEPEQN